MCSATLLLTVENNSKYLCRFLAEINICRFFCDRNRSINVTLLNISTPVFKKWIRNNILCVVLQKKSFNGPYLCAPALVQRPSSWCIRPLALSERRVVFVYEAFSNVKVLWRFVLINDTFAITMKTTIHLSTPKTMFLYSRKYYWTIDRNCSRWSFAYTQWSFDCV